jgi:hypothetical protein
MFNFFKKPKPSILDQNINFTPRRIMSTEDMLPDKARMDFENTWRKIFDQAVHPELLKNKVVMDETNNTPDVIDRNLLVGAIYLQPTRTAEFIQLDFNILPTGVTFG